MSDIGEIKPFKIFTNLELQNYFHYTHFSDSLIEAQNID